MLSTFVMPVAQALRQQGIEPLELLEAVGIDLARAANPDWRVSQETFYQLMARCVAETGDEAFGLVAAELLQPQALRGLGLAWLASDTVYDGLRRLVRFSHMVSTGVNLSLAEEGDLVHFCLEDGMGAADGVYPGRDYAVGIITRMCRLTVGDFLAPVIIRIERPAPRQPEHWEYMLASRVAFGSAATRITWSRSDIEEPLVTGDPALARVNDAQVQAYLDSFMLQSVSREVVDKILERLPDGPPSQQQIAESLCVSNRTLQRKLREEGSTFKELLQDARLQLAREYLSQPNRSVVETAYMLGFSEPSTFSRAFKRWTGMAPTEFRDSATTH